MECSIEIIMAGKNVMARQHSKWRKNEEYSSYSDNKARTSNSGVLCMLVHEIHGSFASIRAIFSCKCHWLQINIVYITQQCVYGILPKKEKR